MQDIIFITHPQVVKRNERVYGIKVKICNYLA